MISSTISLKEIGYGAGGSVVEVEVDVGIMLSKVDGSVAASWRSECTALAWVDMPLMSAAEEHRDRQFL